MFQGNILLGASREAIEWSHSFALPNFPRELPLLPINGKSLGNVKEIINADSFEECEGLEIVLKQLQKCLVDQYQWWKLPID